MTSIRNHLWIMFLAAPLIPSCRSWLLKTISESSAIRSKFWIHALLVCAISGGDIRISLRSFFNLNSLYLDKRFDNQLERKVNFSFRICNLWSVENRVTHTFCSSMSSVIFPGKFVVWNAKVAFFISGVLIQITISFREFACLECYLKIISYI